jgi:hypothetical protein
LKVRLLGRYEVKERGGNGEHCRAGDEVGVVPVMMVGASSIVKELLCSFSSKDESVVVLVEVYGGWREKTACGVIARVRDG